MKDMMMQIRMMAVLLVAGTAFVACTNEDDAIEPTPTVKMTVMSSKGGEAVTRGTLSGGGESAISAEWAADDEVEVYDASSTLLGTLKAQSAGATTKLTGEVSSFPASGELTLKYKAYDAAKFATQGGTLDYIAQNCDYAVATLDASKFNINGNTYTASETAEFVNQYAIVRFKLYDSEGTNTIAANSLAVTVGDDLYMVTPASMARIIADKFHSGEMTVELLAIDKNGILSTLEVGYDRLEGDSEGIITVMTPKLDFFQWDDSKPKYVTIAMRVKDNVEGGTDYVTTFTPIDYVEPGY